MATFTPNIDLTLPIGTEHVSRSVFNQNMTKIDTAIGSIPSGHDLYGDLISVATDLGDPSSASGVTGADAFSKISTLNSNLISRTRPSENAISYTLKSGFSLESWGQINVRVVSGILLINIGGLKTNHAINADEEFIEFTNFTFANMGSSYGVVWLSNRDKPGNISVFSSKLWLNRIPVDAIMSFQLSVPIYV